MKDTKAGETTATFPSKVIEVNEGKIKSHVEEIVRGSVEETLNMLLESEAEQLCQASRYERTPGRKDTRAGHYSRKLQTRVGDVELKIPKLRTLPFETAIIERYRRREASVEEALIEMYLAGVSVRRVEDITEALWGSRVSPSVISDLNKKLYVRIEEWLNRPITSRHAYVYMDGLWLKRTWGGEVKNVSVLVAIGVDEDGFRDVLGVAEGGKEDKESWKQFLRGLKERGLSGVSLFISDKCLGLLDTLGEFYPDAQWQRCVVHFYRNVMTAVPKGKVREVAAMLKAIHAQEDRDAALQKSAAVVEKLESMKLSKAASIVREGAEETLRYYGFPREHWRSLRTNNPLERLNREIRRRTRVVGCFPDGRSAVMLVAARLRHVTGTQWGSRCYLNMLRLAQHRNEMEIASGLAVGLTPCL